MLHCNNGDQKFAQFTLYALPHWTPERIAPDDGAHMLRDLTASRADAGTTTKTRDFAADLLQV
jgi:hypothetical protein